MKSLNVLKGLLVFAVSMFSGAVYADTAAVETASSAEVAGQCGVQPPAQVAKKNGAKTNGKPAYDQNGREASSCARARRLNTQDYETYSLQQSNVDARGRDLPATPAKKK